jgi:hypothetical protein
MAETIEIPVKDWLEMNRRIGMAEGLLMGWMILNADETDNARQATKRFLEAREGRE